MDPLEEAHKENFQYMRDMKIFAGGLRTEAAKVQIALNGGGAVAMLGFMQSLVGKANELNIFKTFGVIALFTFSIGGFFGAVTFHFRSQVVEYISGDSAVSEETARWHGRFGRVTMLLSILAFLVGIAIAGAGICRAL